LEIGRGNSPQRRRGRNGKAEFRKQKTEFRIEPQTPVFLLGFSENSFAALISRARARRSREIAEQGRECQFPTAALESSMGPSQSDHEKLERFDPEEFRVRESPSDPVLPFEHGDEHA
jgi:hypothetical protein